MEYSRKVIERGRTYVNEDRVLSVTPDKEKNVWHAESIGDRIVFSDLRCYSQRGGLLPMSVLGRASLLQTHGGSRTLSTQTRENTKINEQTPIKSLFCFRDVSNGFARLGSEKKRANPQVEFRIDTIATNHLPSRNGYLRVSLKVGHRGTARTYVVKNIYKFCRCTKKTSSTQRISSRPSFYLRMPLMRKIEPC